MNSHMNSHGLLFWLGIILPTGIGLLMLAVLFVCWFRQGCGQPCWFSKRSAANEAARSATLAALNQRYLSSTMHLPNCGTVPRSATQQSHLSRSQSSASSAEAVDSAAAMPVKLNGKELVMDKGVFAMSYPPDANEDHISWDKYMIRESFHNTTNSKLQETLPGCYHVTPDFNPIKSSSFLSAMPTSHYYLFKSQYELQHLRSDDYDHYDMPKTFKVSSTSYSCRTLPHKSDADTEVSSNTPPPQLPPTPYKTKPAQSFNHCNTAIAPVQPLPVIFDKSQTKLLINAGSTPHEQIPMNLTDFKTDGSVNFGYRSEKILASKRRPSRVSTNGSTTDSGQRELLIKTIYHSPVPLHVSSTIYNNHYQSVIRAQMHTKAVHEMESSIA